MNKLCLTSLACLVCLAPLRAQVSEVQGKKQTILYLQKLQTKEGGFLPEAADPKSNRAPKMSLRATSSAIRALKYFGGDLPNKDACIKFVASCFDKDTGGFSDTPASKADVFTTAVGLMAAADLELPAETYRAQAVKYLTDNAKTFDEIRIAAAGLERINQKSPKHDDWVKVVKLVDVPPGGGEHDARARVLASKSVTLLRLGGDPKDVSTEMRAILRAGQRPNGGFGKDNSPRSDLESTYRVMRAFMMLKEQPAKVEDLRNFIHKCRNEDGGYSVVPGDPSSVSGTYYAGIVLHWLDEKK